MRPCRSLLVVLPVLLVVAGCSTTVTVPRADVESTIAGEITAALALAPDEVRASCPGDLDGTVGATLDCVVAGAAGDLPVQVVVTAVEGSHVYFDINDAPASPAPGSS